MADETIIETYGDLAIYYMARGALKTLAPDDPPPDWPDQSETERPFERVQLTPDEKRLLCQKAIFLGYVDARQNERGSTAEAILRFLRQQAEALRLETPPLPRPPAEPEAPAQ